MLWLTGSKHKTVQHTWLSLPPLAALQAFFRDSSPLRRPCLWAVCKFEALVDNNLACFVFLPTDRHKTHNDLNPGAQPLRSLKGQPWKAQPDRGSSKVELNRCKMLLIKCVTTYNWGLSLVQVNVCERHGQYSIVCPLVVKVMQSFSTCCTKWAWTRIASVRC